MFEKKLTPENNWLTILPLVIILLVAAATLISASSAGTQPREAVFSMFMRMEARDGGPVASDRFVVVDIDEESLDRIGPWPWPRTELANLVDIARRASARSVVITVPVAGPDPLSPEIVGRYWFERDTDIDGELVSAISRLPSHDVALGQALSQIPAAVAVAEMVPPEFYSAQGWTRTGFDQADWLTMSGDVGGQGTGYSLPTSLPRGDLSNDVSRAALATVSALPADPDGIVRRARLIWNANEQALPSAALGAILTTDGSVVVQPHQSVLHSSGHPIAAVSVNGNVFPLDRHSSTRIYLPQNLSVQTIPAWRVIGGNDSWRQALRGKTVFIGESVTSNARVATARGDLPRTQVHALIADQLADGTSISRPEWTGLAEAAIALLLGVAAILCLLLFSNLVGVTFTVVTSVLLLVINWLIFANSGVLIDPVPGILAMAGSQIGFGVSSLIASVLRDDKVRGAFHGALPASTMNRLQKEKGNRLLDGVRRQVTVLSCSIRLPDDMVAEFLNKPDDYVRFRAKTNDKLRQSILNLGGTVDYGEDGRLLGYWNVPEEITGHIERACSCALQMIEDMNALAQDLQSSKSAFPLARISDEAGGSAFERGHLEIGISSDVCFSGPVGRGARNRYAVIGPSVALASALRERSRLYGPAIVCDETVFAALRHHFAFLDLDTLRINDQPQPRQIYGLVGNPFLKASKTFRRMADTQRELVNAWRDGDIKAGQAYLKQLNDLPGIHHAFIALYEERLHAAELEAADAGKMPDGWDGSQQIYI